MRTTGTGTRAKTIVEHKLRVRRIWGTRDYDSDDETSRTTTTTGYATPAPPGHR
jgi:hypothetical protein